MGICQMFKDIEAEQVTSVSTPQSNKDKAAEIMVHKLDIEKFM